MLTQYPAQSFVGQVGSRVVAGCIRTPLLINLSRYRFTHFQGAGNHFTGMEMVTGLLFGIENPELASPCLQYTGVAYLATRFGVEGRLLQYDNRFRACGDSIHGLAINKQGFDNITVCHIAKVTGKLGLTFELQAFAVVCTKVAGSTGPLTLPIHALLVALFVNGQATLTGDIVGEIDREAVSVIKGEYGFAGNHCVVTISGERSNILFQNLHALIEGAGKLLLFFLEGSHHLLLLIGHDFGTITHHLHQCWHQLVEERFGCTELVAVTTGTTNNPAQGITTTIVRRQHPIANQEGTGTDMVGNNTQ